MSEGAVGPLVRPNENDHVDALLFLVNEAEVADAGDLSGWLDLLAPEIDYSMPVRVTRTRADVDDSPPSSFHYKEDRGSLELRVRRIVDSDSAWSENPASRVRRFVSNVRVRRFDDGDLQVSSYLLLLRSRHDRDSFEILSADRRDRLTRDAAGNLLLCERDITIDQARLGLPNLPFPV